MHTSLTELFALHQAAATPRYDLYARIHKGVRLLLGDTLAQAGRVDADDRGAVVELVAQVERLADFCTAHLEHENAFVHPALERAVGGTSQRIAAEHAEHERDIDALRMQARALVACEPARRAAACHALYLALSLFTAHNLAHMLIEETAHNAVLWAHYDDAQIAAIEVQIVAQLTPALAMESMRWMIPALAPSERLELLRGMQAQAPAPAFDAVLALARELLGDADWAALARGLGRPVAPGLTA